MWYSHYMYVTPFIAVPQVLAILFCFIFQSFCFSVLEVSIVISLGLEILYSATFMLLRIKSIHFHYNVSDLYHFFLILPQRPNLLLT